MAYRAGASVVDLEFVSSPDSADGTGQPRFLLSEALRGEGARLINASGEASWDGTSPRAIWRRAIACRVRVSGKPDRSPCSSHSRDSTPIRPRAFSSHLRRVSACRPGLARDRFGRPAAHYVMGESNGSRGRTSFPASSPPARSRARACTARIAASTPARRARLWRARGMCDARDLRKPRRFRRPSRAADCGATSA